LAKRFPNLALPLCLLLVGACDRQQDRSTSKAPQAASNEGRVAETGVRLALLPPSGDTDMAALEGALHADGRCLYIVGNDKTKNRTLPAFALEGVRWDEDSRTLRVRDSEFTLGQRVLLGGGEPANPAALRWVQRPDPSCDASDLFVVGTVDPATPSPGR
jgi:hypothetical protein